MSSDERITSLEDQLMSVKRQLRAAKRELHELRHSKSFRIGSFLVGASRAPLRLVGRGNQFLPKLEIEKWVPFIEGTISFEGSDLKVLHLVVEIENEDVAEATVYRDNNDKARFTVKYPPSHQFDNWNAISLRWDGGFLTPSGSTLQQPPPTALERAVATVKEHRINNQLPASLKGGDIAIVSTFRPPGRSTHSLLAYIKSLAVNGFQTIVVDTSESVPQEDEKIIRSEADYYIPRDNIGWDFSSWLSTIALFPELESNSNRIILTNDSNFGPFSTLETYLNPNDLSKNHDVWGLTESLQYVPHLQSFFLVFERSALNQKVLSGFANSYRFPPDKRSIILNGEVALTQFLLEKGCRIGVHHSYESLADEFLESFDQRISTCSSEESYFDPSGKAQSPAVSWNNHVASEISRNVALNPTHYFWDILIENGYPFIKRELLTQNPTHVPNLRQRLRHLLSRDDLNQILNEVKL